MTQQEREAETQRLMAILNGTEDVTLLVTETGALMGAAEVEEELKEVECDVCGTEISPRTESTDDQICEACRLTHWANYETCEQCHGKRLLFVDRQWHACGICDGTGRTFWGWGKCPPHKV